MLRVLVVTALQEELNAVLRLKSRSREDWSQKKTLQGYIYYEAEFQDSKGKPFEMIAATQPKMGKVACASHVTRMLHLAPHFSFMTGICAGRRKKGIELGDIIVADKAFDYEIGKQSEQGFEPEMCTGSPNHLVVQWLNDFNAKKIRFRDLMTTSRPVSLRFQKEWILFQLERKNSEGIVWPASENDFAESRRFCPNWEQALQSLYKDGFVKPSLPLELTETGINRIKQIKTEYLISTPRPDKDDTDVWIGAFATGSSVVALPDFFDKLAQRERNVLALDMEASAFLEAVSSNSGNLPCVVIKGVCDYADNEKDDNFHEYAADAAAGWMLAFAQYSLSLIDNNQEDSQSEEVIYSIGLPRPAKTFEDRKRWQAVLQWSSAEEEFLAERFKEHDSSGMEFYTLGKKEYLLEVTVGLFAYQESYLYYYLDERSNIPKWNSIGFRQIFYGSSETRELNETVIQELCGLPYFDLNTNTLSVFCKARGLGDCGSVATYKIQNGTAILIELRIRECADNNGEIGEDEAFVDPDEWPLIDVKQEYTFVNQPDI